MKLIHKHLIVRGKISQDLRDPEYITLWMKKLIKALDMDILIGPHSIYHEEPGNTGVTSFAVITTSHIAIHTFIEDDCSRIEVDVYSCKEYEPATVIDLLNEFGLHEYNCKFFDRDDNFTELGV